MMQLTLKQKISLSILLIGIIFGGIWYFFFRQTSPTEISDNTGNPIPAMAENNDDIRIRHLTLIEKALKEAILRNSLLPLPENALQVNFEELPIVYQGKTGRDFFDTLGLNDLVDPANGTRYDYALSADKKTYQIATYLDDVQRSNTLLEKAAFYSIWNVSDLFIRDFAGNIIHREKVGAANMDMSHSETRKKIWLEPLKSCKEISILKWALTKPKSGVYVIDINGRDTKVFCDMQTDGGGWTLFYANNWYEDSPIQKSYVEMRDTMETEPLLDLSNYDDQYLAGLLNYKHFTELGASEILVRNRTGDVKKWVKFTFSASRILEWALWFSILGETDHWCIDVTRRGTWGIVSNDKTIHYEKLTQIMNHGGTSWGVSHEKYLCNNYDISISPHVAFYDAKNHLYDWRTRSNEGFWGQWWAGNEYRYFIR